MCTMKPWLDLNSKTHDEALFNEFLDRELSGIDGGLRYMIKSMLKLDPNERVSANEACLMLDACQKIEDMGTNYSQPEQSHFEFCQMDDFIEFAELKTNVWLGEVLS